MDINQKIETINRRIESVFLNQIKPDFAPEYVKGFEHASTLINIALKKEFGTYSKVQTNKHQEIRDLEKLIEKTDIALNNQKIYAKNLELKLNEISEIEINRSTRNKLIRAVSKVIGLPYEVIKSKFSKPILLKENNQIT